MNNLLNTLDLLKNTYDIKDISLLHEKGYYSLTIRFEWLEDCGCFDIEVESCLTVLFPIYASHIIDNDLQKNGKIFQYIINHKQYKGELLDYRKEYNLETRN